MDVTAVIIAVVIGVPTLYLAWVSYRDRWPQRRLEYLVVTNSRLLPTVLSDTVELTHEGEPVAEPTLVVVRLVNSGDSAVTVGDFNSDLTLTFEGSTEIPYAIVSGQRPADLNPDVRSEANILHVRPLLLNSGDLIEVQCLTEHQPTKVRLGGRVREVDFEQRFALPYPPGSGDEGAMIGFDIFMWWVLIPGGLLAIGIAVAADSSNSIGARLGALGGALLSALWLYPLRVRQLVERRRLWRPEEALPRGFWRRYLGLD